MSSWGQKRNYAVRTPGVPTSPSHPSNPSTLNPTTSHNKWSIYPCFENDDLPYRVNSGVHPYPETPEPELENSKPETRNPTLETHGKP